jgi:hypothetical protein
MQHGIQLGSHATLRRMNVCSISTEYGEILHFHAMQEVALPVSTYRAIMHLPAQS